MRIGVSLGGKLLYTEDGRVNVEFIQKFARILQKSKKDFVIGVGGGKFAKTLVEGGKALGANSFFQDYLGITATSANALLIKIATNGRICSFNELLNEIPTEKTIIVYGSIPGITTDSDTILASEALGVKKVINLSDSILYDKDPKKFKDAKPIHKISYDELINIAVQQDTREARMNFIFDLLACKLAKRAGIELHFVSSLEDFERAINGKKHNGTVITSKV